MSVDSAQGRWTLSFLVAGVCVCSRGLEEDQLASKRREVPLGKAQGLPSTSSLYVVGFFFYK